MADKVAETPEIDPSESPSSPGEKRPEDGVDYAEGDEGEEAAGAEWQDIPEGSKFEFLDHTADVQLHAWGDTLKESFEQVALSMFAYMTEISKVDKLTKVTIQAEGDDILSLLYHYLDEFLFVFSADPFFIPREVTIDELDLKNFKIKATGHGETFDLTKHPQGTEVKAITYSNMQVHSEKVTHDIYVIIDI